MARPLRIPGHMHIKLVSCNPVLTSGASLSVSESPSSFSAGRMDFRVLFTSRLLKLTFFEVSSQSRQHIPEPKRHIPALNLRYNISKRDIYIQIYMHIYIYVCVTLGEWSVECKYHLLSQTVRNIKKHDHLIGPCWSRGALSPGLHCTRHHPRPLPHGTC